MNSKMLQVALVGFGRTGRVVADEILTQKTVTLGAVFKKHRDEFVGKDIGSILFDKPNNGYVHLISELPDVLDRRDIDVVIDFSDPHAVVDYVGILAEKKVNLVICATNFTKEQQNRINNFGDRIGIVWAPNVTEGINILISLGKVVKSIWPDADIEILEYHFSRKKDISKTALKIAEVLADEDSIKIGRKKNEPRIGKETVIHTIRVGGIIGKHSIVIGQPHQTITITHESLDRHAFGKGALTAANWIKGKTGVYSMLDVLNLC